MNIVLFGEDIYSATVLKSLIDEKLNVQLVICPYYENDTHYNSVKKVAEDAGIKIIREKDVNSDLVKKYIQDLKPDLIISVHLRKILFKQIYSLAKMGAINIHPSLLPKYQGLSPQHQAILNGDRQSGVTVHFIDEELDTGDIIIQRTFEIQEDDYISNIQIKMLTIYNTLILEAINLLTSENFKPVKQDLSKSSFFGALRKQHRIIDLNKSKTEIYNLIRAVSQPYQGAVCNNYVIWNAHIPDLVKEEQLIGMYPNKGLFELSEDELLIRVEDGIIISDDFENTN